ncbi:hemerythrin domain-containing protein [Candidatus Pacearchaeota archaeon]|jgi:hypothetical protein|nr:hemerythrin domain-containing protein [Candidatus Pacearchaeota archaeon]
MIGPITAIMLKHHAIVNRSLSDFETISEKNSIDAKESFDIFKWNLEKHMAVEEKKVFSVADKNNKKELKELKNLLKDHEDLRAIVSNIYEDVIQRKKPNVKILQELLSAHEAREVESFYPKLDERLSEEEKKEIAEEVKNVNLKQ